MHTFKNILITGGCGFIGINFIHSLLGKDGSFEGNIINLDKLTYVANPEPLSIYEHDERYHFVQGDICDEALVTRLIAEHEVDAICHFAAESHVDNSIATPHAFMQTNVMGTFSLLEAVRKSERRPHFHHISTDEVYGSLSLESENLFSESTSYSPHSPYSASKAASDHLVQSYHHTYGLSTTMSHCSNNYGPHQHKEKLIPLMVNYLLKHEPLPVYGQGTNVRDWIHVDDHNAAVWQIMRQGINGVSYNIGARNEWSNNELVRLLCALVSEQTGEPLEALTQLITYVPDRLGHDVRYGVDPSQLEQELGWRPHVAFKEGLRAYVAFCRQNHYG
jgi:dTDP-glucose 4,6-dehydratase